MLLLIALPSVLALELEAEQLALQTLARRLILMQNATAAAQPPAFFAPFEWAAVLAAPVSEAAVQAAEFPAASERGIGDQWDIDVRCFVGEPG